MQKVDYNGLHNIGRELLVAIGEDPDRPGLIDTPRRFADSWKAFIEYAPGKTETTFDAVTADQMVVVKGMRVWSLCEHHLLPFWCDVSVGYIAKKKILGLSKFARVAHQHAHKLQVQEQLVHDIATHLQEQLDTIDIAVFARGEHLCMTMRGIKTPSEMISSAMFGKFRSSHSVRSEFLSLVK